MTRLHAEVGGVNLAQGLPDFHPPRELSDALAAAIGRSENHQYGFTWGVPSFREAIAEKTRRVNGIASDPETEVTVTCGVSEGVASAVLGLTEPGDEAIVLDLVRELRSRLPAGRSRALVRAAHEARLPTGPAALARAMTRRTRILFVNSPANPSGRVFSREELSEIARLCQRHGVIAVTDEIYEHIWFDGHRHVSLGSLPGMEDRTVTLSGLGKTYAVTGWRRGGAPLTALVRKVHDYLTICAPTAFQDAGRVALALPESYYELRRAYDRRRGILLDALRAAGFAFATPEGAYYVMVDGARSAGRTTGPWSTSSRARSGSSPCPDPASMHLAAAAAGPRSESTSRRPRRRCARPHAG
jgi:aminotransferase